MNYILKIILIFRRDTLSWKRLWS